VERAAKSLTALDDTDSCLSAGGDIICHTANAERADWRIGIEHPLQPRQLIAMLPIRSGAVATSGTAHRGQHLMDARTGQPARGAASVTAIVPSLTWPTSTPPPPTPMELTRSTGSATARAAAHSWSGPTPPRPPYSDKTGGAGAHLCCVR